MTSEELPVPDGNDDAYGFMAVEITLTELTINAYTHGGTEEKMILRSQTKVTPKQRKSKDELIKLGLVEPEDKVVV